MPNAFAHLLRRHRARMRWSQEQLGLAANVSSRHLSYLETAKAQPSRAMVSQLAEVLELDLRECNALLVSAGFAATYPTTSLGELAMAPVNRAIELLLAQQEPYAAMLVDRCWNVMRLNEGARRMFATFVDPSNLPAHVAHNLVRVTLHPAGLRPYIVNWPEVASLLLERVERAHQLHPGDEERRALVEEIRDYPGVDALPIRDQLDGVPAATLQLRRAAHDLTLFALLTTIGTPFDVTAQELTIESLFPANDATERWFRALP